MGNCAGMAKRTLWKERQSGSEREKKYLTTNIAYTGNMKKSKKKVIVAAAGFMACCYAVLNWTGKRAKNGKTENVENSSFHKGVEKSGKQKEGEGHPDGGDVEEAKESAYEKSVKPALDKVLSFAGLLLLAPLYAGLSIAVFVDDLGPVIFTQERIGKNKKIFLLHKFRSMKMSTPHDVPTHQLKNPEQYITRVGKFLRKYSLDELPQIWDIFIGCL